MKYRTEIIELAGGPNSPTTMALDNFAAEGWELFSSHVVVTKSSGLAHGQPGMGLVVILRRREKTPYPKGSGDEPSDN